MPACASNKNRLTRRLSILHGIQHLPGAPDWFHLVLACSVHLGSSLCGLDWGITLLAVNEVLELLAHRTIETFSIRSLPRVTEFNTSSSLHCLLFIHLYKSRKGPLTSPTFFSSSRQGKEHIGLPRYPHSALVTLSPPPSPWISFQDPMSCTSSRSEVC